MAIPSGTFPPKLPATATEQLLQPGYAIKKGLSTPIPLTGRPVQTGQNPALDVTGIISINGNTNAAQIIKAGTGIAVASSDGTITITATGGGGGGVASVTASSPLASSGGTNPNISIVTPIPVSDGGTGTATPGLIAGTNVTITGAWPDQTINATGGGGGTVTSVTASSPLASSGGTTPNISIAVPVPVVDGGTGTAAPTLFAGSGISVTGSWPDQTITNTSPSSGGTVTSVGLSLPSIFTVSGSPVTTSGTLTAVLASEIANTFFAAPNGSAGVPTFRVIVDDDINPIILFASSVFF